MNKRFFKFARAASLKADYTGGRNNPVAIGAIAVYKKSIVAEAWNTDKTSTLQDKYNKYRYHNPSLLSKSHAEISLVQKLRWKFGDSLDWSKVEIYTYREYKDGSLACSKPCRSCEKCLLDFGIRTICWTDTDGYVEKKYKINK